MSGVQGLRGAPPQPSAWQAADGAVAQPTRPHPATPFTVHSAMSQVTAEIITHRYTLKAKTLILTRYPKGELPMDEARRKFKLAIRVREVRVSSAPKDSAACGGSSSSFTWSVARGPGRDRGDPALTRHPVRPPASPLRRSRHAASRHGTPAASKTSRAGSGHPSQRETASPGAAPASAPWPDAP